MAIGIYARQGDPRVWVYLEAFEAIGHFDLGDGEMKEFGTPSFYFESTNCTGLAFTDRAARLMRPNIGDNSLYIVTRCGPERPSSRWVE